MKKLLLVLILLGVALAGMAYWISRPRGTAVSEDLFTYVPAERGTLTEAVSGTGLIQPRDVVLVHSEQSGTTLEILGKINDVVAEGDVLLRLDDRKERLKVQEAADGLATAQAAVAQAESLRAGAELALKYQIEIESKGGFRSERDQAEVKLKAADAGVLAARARLRGAETNLQQAQLTLDRTVLKVPALPPVHAAADGEAGTTEGRAVRRSFLILDRKVELGQLVGPGAQVPLFTLAGDLGRVEVHTEIAEGDIDRVRRGLPATFTVSSSGEPDLQFHGSVRQIRPMPANVKGAVYYNVVLEVANEKNPETEEWRLRPGMTASVDIIRQQHKDVWKVPTAALNFQMDEAYQTMAARARLAEWRQRADQASWRPVWVWDAQQSGPWPVFVRLTDPASGKAGIKAGDFNEVLEWEPGRAPRSGTEGPRLIINAPPARAPGLFDQPASIKVS